MWLTIVYLNIDVGFLPLLVLIPCMAKLTGWGQIHFVFTVWGQIHCMSHIHWVITILHLNIDVGSLAPLASICPVDQFAAFVNLLYKTNSQHRVKFTVRGEIKCVVTFLHLSLAGLIPNPLT